MIVPKLVKAWLNGHDDVHSEFELQSAVCRDVIRMITTRRTRQDIHTGL